MSKTGDWFWLAKGFKSEFGISDVRANYSRTYSWMANQLGHLTLGLGTVLAYYWIVELAESVKELCFSNVPQIDATFFGLLFANLISATIVVFLSRHNLLLMLLGLFAVFGSLAFTRWTFGEKSLLYSGTWPPTGYEWICVVALVLFIPPLFAVIDKKESSSSSIDSQFYLVSALCLAAWFTSTCFFSFDKEWKVTAAAALSTMAIWTVKEFAGDMRTVHVELENARKGRCSACSKGDKGASLDREYLCTAIWDSRTDTMFYLAGALIGAGLISDVSATTGSKVAWSFDLELIGLFFFLVFFIFGGRNWAYRQQAVDRTGTARANMMAVIEFCIDLHIVGTSGKVCEPRLMLHKFARGESSQEETLDHLVVFGAGRLNERLADALVTEAALTSLPAKWFSGTANRCKWRRARKISFARLCQYDPINLSSEELPYYPVRNLRYKISGKGRMKRRIVFKCEPAGSARSKEKGVTNDYAADLVAVTRCNPTRLVSALGTISDNKDQRTVWFFEDKDGKKPHVKAKILCELCCAYGDTAKIGVATCK